MPAIDVVRLNQFMAFLPRKGRMSVLCRLSSKSVRASRLLGVPANSASRASAHSARASRQYRLSPRHQAFFSASLASATLDGSTEGIARFLGSPFYHENSCGVWAMIPRYRLQPLMVLCRTLCRMISRVRIQQQTNDQSQIAPGERARRSCQVSLGTGLFVDYAARGSPYQTRQLHRSLKIS